MPTVLGLSASSKTTSAASAMGSGKGRLDTISKRNHAAAIEIETLLWRALCDSPDAAKEYMAADCVMINPLFSNGIADPLTKDTEPTIDAILEGGRDRWTSYRMHGEPKVVEIDMMAVAVLYRISLYRHGKGGKLEEVEATVSSSWRQTAGADWLLCAQHVAYAD